MRDPRATQQTMAELLLRQWWRDGKALDDAEAAVADHHAILSTIIIDEEWRDMAPGAIVEDIIRRYLSREGIVAGEIVEGNVLAGYQGLCRPVAEVFDELARIEGVCWRMDWNKAIIFQ
jgi:hypothetical protein